MKALYLSFSIVLLSSLFYGCCKETICDKLPCDESNKSVKNFSDINFRRGTWVSVTDVRERSTGTSYIYFYNDSIWSYIGIYKTDTSGIYRKPYIFISGSSNVGQVRNHYTFFGPDTAKGTKDYRTYDWLYDDKNQILYFDFNKDSRFSGQPVVYSKFIKISD